MPKCRSCGVEFEKYVVDEKYGHDIYSTVCKKCRADFERA